MLSSCGAALSYIAAAITAYKPKYDFRTIVYNYTDSKYCLLIVYNNGETKLLDIANWQYINDTTKAIHGEAVYIKGW